jgi:hypothetical protein
LGNLLIVFIIVKTPGADPEIYLDAVIRLITEYLNPVPKAYHCVSIVTV